MERIKRELEEKVIKALEFNVDRLHLKFLAFFDVIGQIHSVVKTSQGNEVMRIWVGRVIEDHSLSKIRSKKLFRTNQDCFQQYIVEPRDDIGNTIKEIGGNCILDIDIYDEYRKNLGLYKAGDYVVVSNIHYRKAGQTEVLVLHGGGAKFGRGIKKISLDYYLPEFQKFRRKVEDRIAETKLTGPYQEFVSDSVVISNEPCCSKDVEFPDIEKIDFDISSIPNEKIIRPCRKIILGDNTIAVDYFSKLNPAKFNFLTHAHSDHCRNLDDRWSRPIFCTKETADVVAITSAKNDSEGIDPDMFVHLTIGQKTDFEDFQVTLFDANHCPGAVMFLFEGEIFPEGGVLCTGDFRADSKFLKNVDELKSIKLSHVYFDNTYLHVDAEFPERGEAKKQLIEKVKSFPDKNIYLPLYKLGREELLDELSRILEEPLEIYEIKLKIIKALKYYTFYGRVRDRKICIVDKTKWRCTEAPKNSVVFEVSMMNFNRRQNNSEEENPKRIPIIPIPFSDHSSKIEILRFLRLLNFESLTPIANAIHQNVKTYLQSLSTKKCEKPVEDNTRKRKRTEDEEEKDAWRYIPEGFEAIDELPVPKNRKELLEWLCHVPELRKINE